MRVMRIAKVKQQAKRNGLSLGASVEKKLFYYATAASAAGVSLAALTPCAEGKIVYTQVHKVIGPNTVYMLDVDHDGTADFALSNNYVSSTGVRFADLLVNGVSGNGFQASGSGFQVFPFALKKGAKINRTQPFRSQHGLMVKIGSAVGGTFWTSGKWAYAANRYLGLKFAIHGKSHYGWARFSVFAVADPPYVRSTITGYAYETIPNKPIIAGKTKGADVITIEPAGLGALAAGANGLSVWRKK